MQKLDRSAEPSSFIKIAGLLSILSALGYLGTMISNFTQLSRLAYGWFGIFATILLIPAMWGLYLHQHRDAKQPLIMLGIIVMFIGSVFVVGIYLAAMISAQFEAFYASMSDQAVVDSIDAALAVFNLVMIIVGSFLTYGVSPLLLGLAAMPSKTMPQWVSWLAVIGGIAGFYWIGFGWLFPISPLLILPSALLITFWQLAIGFYMLRGYEKKQG